MLRLWRFMHLRRILRLAAGTIPPSCGDDLRLFLFFFVLLVVHVCCNKWPFEEARPAAASISVNHAMSSNSTDADQTLRCSSLPAAPHVVDECHVPAVLLLKHVAVTVTVAR